MANISTIIRYTNGGIIISGFPHLSKSAGFTASSCIPSKYRIIFDAFILA